MALAEVQKGELTRENMWLFVNELNELMEKYGLYLQVCGDEVRISNTIKGRFEMAHSSGNLVRFFFERD